MLFKIYIYIPWPTFIRINGSTTAKLTLDDLSLEFVDFLSTLHHALEFGFLKLDGGLLLFASHGV